MSGYCARTVYCNQSSYPKYDSIYPRRNAFFLLCAGVRQSGWLWSGWHLCSDPHRVGLDVQSTVGGQCPCRPKWAAQWQHSHEVNTCPKQRKSVSNYTRIVSIPRRTVSSILYKKISQTGSIRHWVSNTFICTFFNKIGGLCWRYRKGSHKPSNSKFFASLYVLHSSVLPFIPLQSSSEKCNDMVDTGQRGLERSTAVDSRKPLGFFHWFQYNAYRIYYFLKYSSRKSGRNVTGVWCSPEKAWMEAKTWKGTYHILNFKSPMSDSSRLHYFK